MHQPLRGGLPEPNRNGKYTHFTFDELLSDMRERERTGAIPLFWESIGQEAFPLTDPQLHIGNGEGGKQRKTGIDPERETFLRRFDRDGERSALFGFTFSGQKGFEDYYCIVFPDHIFIDNIYHNNRAFVRPIPPIDVERLNINFSAPVAERVPSTSRRLILEMLERGNYLPLHTSKQTFRSTPDVLIITHTEGWPERAEDFMTEASRIAQETRHAIHRITQE